ncbi:MAG TPA: porin [Polyangia bacterium]
MRGPVANAGLAAISLMGAFTVAPRLAHADITFYDKDGWSVWTNGRAATHLQLITGDGSPTTGNMLTGWNNTAATNEDNKILRSRIGSGWVGSQIGFGVANQLSETTKLKAYFAVSIDDITNNKDKTAGKGVDYREAFASAEMSWGSITFGRALSVFGTGLAGTIYMYSYGNGAGHPCPNLDGIAITCGPVNAGGIFPGFNAQITYSTPANLGGFGAKISLVDPSLLPGYTLRPTPRLEGELTYDIGLGGTNKISIIGQGLVQSMGRVVAGATETATAAGGIGALRLEFAGFRLGLGGWGGNGLGTGVPLQGDQAVDPTGKLRSFVGVMAHGNYMIGNWEFGAGFGQSKVAETDDDKAAAMRSLIESNTAIHGVVYRHVGPLVLGAEVMRWTSKWHRGEEQTVMFSGLSANLLW